jgi:hypothetical protein
LAPLGLGCTAARYARLYSASPQRGQGGRKKNNLQKDFYTPRTAFNKDSLQEAQDKYLQIELQQRDNPSQQAVLVSVDSMTQLQRAYPNFYLDIGAFSKVLSRIIR